MSADDVAHFEGLSKVQYPSDETEVPPRTLDKAKAVDELRYGLREFD